MIALAGLGIETHTHASDVAPALSIVDAARSAQVFLDREKLSQDYTIVSIELARASSHPLGTFYQARLDATDKSMANVSAEPVPS